MTYEAPSFYKLHKNNYHAFPLSYDQKCSQAVEILGFFISNVLGGNS